MLSGAGRIYAGAEEKVGVWAWNVGIMQKGKLILHRTKTPIQIVIKRLWSISAGVLLLKLLHIFDFWRCRML